MNHLFEGSVTNSLKDENTSVTVFRKQENQGDRLVEPFYSSNTEHFPRQESWEKSITLTVAVNTPIGDTKTCTVKKIEGGTCNGPTKIGNFKWEIELVSNKESPSDPAVTVELEVGDKE